MKFLIFLLAGLSFASLSIAQPDTVANINSVDKIPYYEQLYRFRVWREMDLREKQNAGFKSAESDIADFLLKSINSGAIPAYDDSVKNVRTAAEMMVKNQALVEPPYNPTKDYVMTESASYQGKNYQSTRNDNKGHLPTDAAWWELSPNQTEYFTKESIVSLMIVEDLIFDKRRSRLYYDIQAIGLMVDRDGNISPLAYILYKDFHNLVEKASHSKDMKVRNQVLWRNRYNPSENKTFADAFKLRLFHGVIEKVENPDNRGITQIYELNGRSYGESIFARWEEEMKLMEKEHNLWEY
jgi:gliding motility associated protien GldN